METFSVTISELQIICAGALRHVLGRNCNITISRTPDITGPNWELIAIEPFPKLSVLADAIDAVAQLQLTFRLHDPMRNEEPKNCPTALATS
jgi:hypothetical protein